MTRIALATYFLYGCVFFTVAGLGWWVVSFWR
jgi:hypothetical protein